jgi:hypothetical protein
MSFEKKHERSSSSASGANVEHDDLPQTGVDGSRGASKNERLEASKKLANPLAGLSSERLRAMGEDYAKLAGLTSDEDIRAFRLGAMIAGDNTQYDQIPELTDSEREALEKETTHKWSNPSMLYWVVISKTQAPSSKPKR